MNKLTVALISIYIGLLNSSTLWAQSDNPDELGFRVGISDIHLIDNHASSLICRGVGIAPEFTYCHKTGASTHCAEIFFSYADTHLSPSNFDTKIYSAKCRYTFAVNVCGEPNHKFDLYVGGSACSFLNRADYFYKYNNLTARAISSWYWSHSLDLSVLMDYSLSPTDLLSLQTFIPVVSNVGRPKYSPAGDYNYTTNGWDMKMFGNTVLFPQNRSVSAGIKYKKALSRKMSFFFTYEFCYARYDKPDIMKMYMNIVQLGISCNL